MNERINECQSSKNENEEIKEMKKKLGESKNKIFYFLDRISLDPELYEEFSRMDYFQLKEFFYYEFQRLEPCILYQQCMEINPDNINYQWIESNIYTFLQILHNQVYFKPISNRVRESIISILEFFQTWSNFIIMQSNEHPLMKQIQNQIKMYTNMIEKSLDYEYSMIELLMEVNKQISNLKKYNDFNPQGLKVAPHMLEVLYKKLEKDEDVTTELIVPDKFISEKNIKDETTEDLKKETKNDDINKKVEIKLNAHSIPNE